MDYSVIKCGKEFDDLYSVGFFWVEYLWIVNIFFDFCF